jgi:PAS domain S-box-containing protein
MNKIKILVVEDESLIGYDIQNMLKNQGYSVLEVVTTGKEALQKVSELAPDLVLMDIVLKGEIDGITAACKIRDSYNIPVVYLTAYTDDITLQRAKSTEPFGYILKPFEERELKTTIEMALYKSQMETKLREREQWLSTILTHIGDGVIATDKEGAVRFMNPLAEKLTGWKQDEALDRPLKEVFNFFSEKNPGELQNSHYNSIREVTENLATEKILYTKNGTLIPIEEVFSPIENEKRSITGGVLVFRDITERKRAEEELKQSFERLRRALDGTIQAMALTLEMRDPYTAGHQRRVSKLSCALAAEMGLPENQIEGLRMAGDIHDIGKIYVPAEILSKPGQLTEIEYTIIKTHPQVGYDILKSIEFSWPVAQIVLQHHERMDGSGYPLGLKGNEILMEARILSVADIVEAMSSHRPYRPSYGIEKALKEILQNRGFYFDPDVVDTCIKIFREKKFKFDE